MIQAPSEQRCQVAKQRHYAKAFCRSFYIALPFLALRNSLASLSQDGGTSASLGDQRERRGAVYGITGIFPLLVPSHEIPFCLRHTPPGLQSSEAAVGDETAAGLAPGASPSSCAVAFPGYSLQRMRERPDRTIYVSLFRSRRIAGYQECLLCFTRERSP